MSEIKIRAILEIAGFPEDHVNKTLDMKEELLKKNLKVNTSKVNKAQAVEKTKFFSGFIEQECMVKKLSDIHGIILDHMPSSIEIVEPETITEDVDDLNPLLNDLIASIHNYDMILKTLKAENTILKKQSEKNPK